MKQNNLDRLISKVITETLEDKANGLATKLNELGGMDDGHPRFGKLNLSKMSDDDIDDLMSSDMSYEDDEEDYFGDDYDTDLLEDDSEMCEQCGKPMAMEGEMYEEGETCECGSKQNLYKSTKFNPAGSEFDYVQEEEDVDFEDEEEVEDEESCKYHMDNFGPEDERTRKFCGTDKMGLDKYKFSMNEKLHGGQKRLDKNHNGKIDAEDFKMLRKDVNEKLYGGQKKIDKNHNGRIDDEDFKMLRKESDEKFIQKATNKMEKKGTEGKFGSWCKRNGLASEDGEVTKECIDKAMKSDNPDVVKMANFAKNIKGFKGADHKKKKSVKLSESEMIDLIEKIIKEEEEKVKSNIKVGTTKGLEKYKQVHDKDGKENKDALEATAKKMKEYLKDGSKGEYETNPKIFPKGNGEIEKMKKKAYVPSGAVEEYVDNLTAAALENIDYDDIKPNEEWVSANIEGSSKTGNNPEWANTGESDVNKKRNKIRKDNMLAKIKRKAYNKAPQPVVNDKAGEDEGDKIMAKLESVDEKQKQKINEEFGRMKTLMGYTQKTQ
jgi:hypothetical protein